ncbi:MAG: hypothetical protein H6658_01935 [Ardenticatenaceae bacterium]|nr:hypothetical protein [Ardenticatenaceae bacterium]
MNDSALFGQQFGLILATAVALLFFSYIYNRFIDYLHQRGLNEGFTWLEVVVGVAFTLLAAMPLIGWRNSLILFGCFACSGFFMAAGDLWRFVKAREAERKQRSNRMNEQA